MVHCAMVFLFILQYLPFSFQKTKGVDESVASLHKTAAYTRDLVTRSPLLTDMM